MKLPQRYSELLRAEVDALAGEYLPGWRVTLVDRPEDGEEDCEASISWSRHTFDADLWLSLSIINAPREERRATIIHELVHPLFRELRLAFCPDEEDDPDGYARWEHAEELIVERVSLAAS